MSRKARLFEIQRLLRDGNLHIAQDLADQLDVSVRTIYRDMEALQVSGIPITGTRGTGYRSDGLITLPPLNLTPQELDALNIAIAILTEASDTSLANASETLGAKVQAALPSKAVAPNDHWKFAAYPYANTAQGLSHITTLRNAIQARQVISLTYKASDVDTETHRVRPLLIEYWGRVWVLTTWSETENTFKEFRIDLIETATAEQELFQDESGKTLKDFQSVTV